MADLRCKQVYVNGNAFNVYDVDAHQSIEQINKTIQDIDSWKTGTIENQLKKLTSEGDYIGNLNWTNKESEEGKTSTKNSGIPFFYVTQSTNDYALHIAFR